MSIIGLFTDISYSYTCTYVLLIDFNECDNGFCEQRCINTIGSFSCECNPGYQLNDDLITCSGIHEYIHN